MTNWYRTGTASVSNGSTAVTGTTTAWLNQAKPGDLITFDNGASVYEVAAVNSNTSITLGTAYAGTTVSGGAYAIARIATAWADPNDVGLKVSQYLDTMPGDPVSAADLASVAAGKGAATIGVEDIAGNITATTVEGALAEIAAALPDGAVVGTTDTQTLTNKTLRADAGSAAAPTLSFDDDTDTGLFRAGANTLGVATGGTERLRVDSNGRLAVGLTAASAQLHAFTSAPASGTYVAVIQDSTNTGLAGGALVSSYLPRLTLEDLSPSADWYDWRVVTDKLILGRGDNANHASRLSDNLLVATADNRIGIGTASPETPLHVAGEARAKVLTSGLVVIADDAAADITTPGGGGLLLLMATSATYAQSYLSAVMSYDAGASPALTTLAVGSVNIINAGATALGGTTGADGKLNMAAKTGAVTVENRTALNPLTFTYIFLGSN